MAHRNLDDYAPEMRELAMAAAETSGGLGALADDDTGAAGEGDAGEDVVDSDEDGIDIEAALGRGDYAAADPYEDMQENEEFEANMDPTSRLLAFRFPGGTVFEFRFRSVIISPPSSTGTLLEANKAKWSLYEPREGSLGYEKFAFHGAKDHPVDGGGAAADANSADSTAARTTRARAARSEPIAVETEPVDLFLKFITP